MSARCVLSEDQFLCCICLDVFTDPVTIPCGHNFCKGCITRHWNINHVRYQCPLCKKSFPSRPELPVNTFISEMAAEFRQSVENKRIKDSDIQVAKDGDIPCDVCSGRKLRALKSCMTCLASYCAIHLDAHLTCESLQKHQLIEPVENMEARVCCNHKKPLELFCKTDEICVCSHCTVFDHAAHAIVSLQEECEARRSELQRVEAEFQEMIGERQRRIQQIQQLKEHRKEDAEREIAHGVRIFTALMQTAERSLNELIEVIEDKQKAAEDQADGAIRELEQEIASLQKSSAEMQLLYDTQDHLLLLQSCAPTNPLAHSLPEMSFSPVSYQGMVVDAVTQLEEILHGEKKQLLGTAVLQRVRHYAADVTLEGATANPWLVLSEEGKRVSCGQSRRDLPDSPERFSLYATVLSRQSISSGRFYYEVRVARKTDWVVGVVRGSVNRRMTIPLSPVNGYWAMGLRNGNEYLSYASPVVSLSLGSRLQVLGVFVSYEEALVSFYDVDAAVEIYSFTGCSFADRLFPFFSPGLHHGGANSAPLVISSVRQSA